MYISPSQSSVLHVLSISSETMFSTELCSKEPSACIRELSSANAVVMTIIIIKRKKDAVSHNYGSSDAFPKLRKTTVSFVMSVRLSVCPSVRVEQLGFFWTDFHEILYLRMFRKIVENIQMSLKSDKYSKYFTWRSMYIFIASHSFLLRMRNVADKIFRENENTHFFEYRTFYEIMWKNISERGRSQMTIWRIHIAFWIPKAANTQTRVV